MVDREALVNEANDILTSRSRSSSNIAHVLSAIGLCLVALTDMAVQERKRFDEDDIDDD